MANYEAFSRSSYFYVTDKAKFKEFVDRIEGAEMWEDDDGRVAFGAYGDITYIPDIGGDVTNPIEDELQPLMVHDEACIITLIGYEKLRYLTALCIVITRDNIDYINAQDLAEGRARELLRNPDKKFQLDH